MPKRVLYFGPFNNKYKEKLIHMSLEKLRNNEGNEFYYLLPNGELLTKYRRDFIDQVEQTFEINLYTFDNIVKNILKGEKYLEINETIKDLIIKKVMRELDSSGELTYYKDFIHMEGFAQSLSGIIGEIKRSLVYPEEFLGKCPDIAYYKEIALIYGRYEEYLKEHNLIDREGSYLKTIEILRNGTSYFKGLEFIIIDEFYDFRPIEIAILKELCKSNIDIYINIPFDMETRSSNIKEIMTILKDIGFQLRYVEKEEEDYFETMGRNFFSHEVPKLNYNEKLMLIKSPSIYLELKKIFEEIKRLNKKDVNLKEIAIVLLSEEYKDVLFQVAKEERVPISLKKENPLIDIPLVKEFLNLINVKINKRDKQSIINRIKSNYFPIIDSEYKYGLEYILRKLNFNNINELVNLLKNEKQLNITIDYIQPIKNISEKIIDELSKIQNQDFIENYNNIFLEIIDEYNIKEKIHERYKMEKDFDLYYRDISSLERLKEVIESLNEISKVLEEISIEDYFGATRFPISA